MTTVTMSDEDRRELERLCARVEEYSKAVQERDEFMTRIYDQYRADPADLQEVSRIRSRNQLYTAFHRYGSTRVKMRTHRPAVRDRQREEGT